LRRSARARYLCDRGNKRIKVLSPEFDILDIWTGMGGPNDISLGKQHCACVNAD
jgi:hypothetical protein